MLVLQSLHKSFGTLKAVDGLSLEVSRGEVFGLLGPNGAGKSTTIAMAMGLLAPDSGEVRVGGRAEGDGGSSSGGTGSPTSPGVRARLGVAPQALALYDELSGEENVQFFGKLYGLSGTRLKDRTTAVLDMVGLEPRRKDRVGGYSGGMKRRLNLAVALIHDPPIVLLDEPTAGVDPQSRNNILDLVRTLAGDGKTIIYTTHYMEEAQKLCSRVGIIDKGKLLALGTVAELVAAHGGTSVVTVTRGEKEERIETQDPLREIAKATSAPATDAPVTSVRIDRPDLESVFLALTGRSLRD